MSEKLIKIVGVNFLSMSKAKLMVIRLELMLQNLTPYGNLEKNFRFLKEAKILSNFVIVNWPA